MGQAQGCAKAGRDKVKCQRYLMKGSREANRMRRLDRLLRKAEWLTWPESAKSRIQTALNKWKKFSTEHYATGMKGRGWRPS